MCHSRVRYGVVCYVTLVTIPPKRKSDASDRDASKKRKIITLEVKVDIIKRSERGETPTNIGKQLGYRRCIERFCR